MFCGINLGLSFTDYEIHVHDIYIQYHKIDQSSSVYEVNKHWLAGWLNGWLAGSMSGSTQHAQWLIQWLKWMHNWLKDWLTQWLIDWFNGWVTHRLIGWLNDWVTHKVHWLTHLWIHLANYSKGKGRHVYLLPASWYVTYQSHLVWHIILYSYQNVTYIICMIMSHFWSFSFTHICSMFILMLSPFSHFWDFKSITYIFIPIIKLVILVWTNGPLYEAVWLTSPFHNLQLYTADSMSCNLHSSLFLQWITSTSRCATEKRTEVAWHARKLGKMDEQEIQKSL